MREAPDFRYVVQGRGTDGPHTGTADLAQFLPPPSNSGPRNGENSRKCEGASASAAPSPTRHLSGHPKETPPSWPASLYTCLLLPSRQEAGWVRIGQVPCSCFRAITPEPHSVVQQTVAVPTLCQGLLIGRNTGTEENQKQREGELKAATAVSPRWGQEIEVLILVALTSVCPPFLDGGTWGASVP